MPIPASIVIAMGIIRLRVISGVGWTNIGDLPATRFFGTGVADHSLPLISRGALPAVILIRTAGWRPSVDSRKAEMAAVSRRAANRAILHQEIRQTTYD